MKKVCFKTFGCKTNQYDTQIMREKFLRSGYVETSEWNDADLFVVNTCTVTGEADRKARSLIRRLHRENPHAKITVTGCYATGNPDEIREIPGVDCVVSNEEKSNIVDRVNLDVFGKFCGEGVRASDTAYEDLPISYFADRTRAFIKVQDGCNHSCTYCKVVLVRGPLRSRPIQIIVQEAQTLSERGYQEIVLTGIQLGSYGDEWGGKVDLVTLLENLVSIPDIKRIRMSSIDPSDITKRLIECMKEQVKICRHLHLPLQSGDNSVLKRMKRAYRREHFLRILRWLREELPDFSLTTDVMVGFPGETEDCFQNTMDVLSEVKPLKAHIFPFSPREGTPAENFQDPVPPTVIRERVQRLKKRCDALALEVQTPFLGRFLEVLLEGSHEGEVFEGHTSNYLKVLLPADPSQVGDCVRVKLLNLCGSYFQGIAV